jgi:myo-inositol-1-phosphate synthase
MNKDKKINIAIIGCGNCSASLLMGISYYQDGFSDYDGLMHFNICGYKPSNIKVVACFDVDKRKIGKDISQAIFEQPNCTKKFSDVPILNIAVQKGPILDGIADHMHDYFQIDENQKELSREEIISVLKKSKTDIIINYLPVGSRQATEFWADIAIDANCIESRMV